jgi:hypothetical protein
MRCFSARLEDKQAPTTSLTGGLLMASFTSSGTGVHTGHITNATSLAGGSLMASSTASGI